VRAECAQFNNDTLGPSATYEYHAPDCKAVLFKTFFGGSLIFRRLGITLCTRSPP
jgi:hypothetical protein